MSLLPAKYNLACWSGATFRTTITVLTGAAGSPAMDLTNYTGTVNIRTAPGTTPVYVLTAGNQGVTLGGSTGTVALYIPAATTTTFTWTAGIYDLYVTETVSPNDVVPLLWGSFAVKGIT